MILKHMLEFHDVLMCQRFMDLYLSYELHRRKDTFCLARERLRELFAIILAAEMRFV